MGKDFGSESIDSIAAAAQQQQQGQQNQLQISVDDTGAPMVYSSQVFISMTPEEFMLNFAAGMRPTGPKSAVIKVDQRVVLNPWAAKRLALQLGQYLQRYEETYGNIEVDERKRRVPGK